MSISATTHWEIQTGGSDTANGGAFDPGNSSMATDLAATLATGTAPVVTSASYNFAARDVGAWLFIKSGTNWIPGWYQIASVASNAATLTATIGSARLWSGSIASGLSTAAGCATTASPTGGTWSIDYSQSTSPGIAFTDLVIDGTTNTKFTSAAKPIGKNMVGNVIAVTSGTGFTVQRIQISSVTGTAGTADKSLGTLSSTGGNGGLGGAMASAGAVGAVVVASNVAFIKGPATFTVSSTTTNVANGRCQSAGGSAASTTQWIGYSTNRTMANTDTRPVIRAGINSAVCFQSFGNFFSIRNLSFDNPTAYTGTKAIIIDNSGCTIDQVSVDAFNTAVEMNSSGNNIFNTYVSNCTNAFTSSTQQTYANCVTKDCANAFNNGSNNSKFFRCIAIGTTSTPAFSFGHWSLLVGCVAYGGTGANGYGFVGPTNTGSSMLVNCIAANNSQKGFDIASTSDTQTCYMFNCAGYSNTGGNTAAVWTAQNNIGFIACSASPFTNPASGDFSLNTTAGGGALLRGAGYPTTFVGISTTNNLDIGAAQHAAGAAAGAFHLAGRGGGLVA